jgi:hypothetical protein
MMPETRRWASGKGRVEMLLEKLIENGSQHTEANRTFIGAGIPTPSSASATTYG